MPTPPPPALDAEDLRDLAHARLSYAIVSDDPATLFKTMALANDGLPDDDPRKLVKADVEMLRNVAGDYETPEGYVMTGRLLSSLAAKLAALLPPD